VASEVRVKSVKVWASMDYNFIGEQRLGVGAAAEAELDPPGTEEEALEAAQRIFEETVRPSMRHQVRVCRKSDRLIDLAFRHSKPEIKKRYERLLDREKRSKK